MWRQGSTEVRGINRSRRRRHIIPSDTYERIAIKHLRYTCRQTIKSQAHADRMTGQIHLRTRHHRNHDRLRNTHRTRRSVRSLTNASTRRRVPHGRSISTIPGRSSIARRASAFRDLRRLPHQQSGRIEPPNCTFVLGLHNRAETHPPHQRAVHRAVSVVQTKMPLKSQP